MPWGAIGGAAIGAIGSLINGKRSSDNAQAQMQMQREFAQNGIRWKVADAKAAGIHPLAALGAQTFSYNPVAVGDDGLGSALQQMGQGITRAVEAKQLQEEREAAQARQEMADVFNMARSQKELEHMDLQNEFLRTQIVGAKNAVAKTALPPPMPKVNDDVGFPHGQSITTGTSPLLGASRLGNSIILHTNPEISDAVTEDLIKSFLVSVATEGKMHMLMPEISRHLTKREIDALKRGDAILEHALPGQIDFLWKPHTAPHYHGNKQTVKGKIIF